MTPGRTAGSGERAARSGRDSARGSRLRALSRRPLGLGARRSALCRQFAAQGSRLAALPGFTLIELLIVISIIGILVTIAQPYYQRAVTAAKEATLKEDLFILRDVIDQYFADSGKYPPALNDLVEKKYIRRIPKDPITGSEETWALIFFTDDQGQQNGVFDIKSGSEAAALDGSRYSDW